MCKIVQAYTTPGGLLCQQGHLIPEVLDGDILPHRCAAKSFDVRTACCGFQTQLHLLSAQDVEGTQVCLDRGLAVPVQSPTARKESFSDLEQALHIRVVDERQLRLLLEGFVHLAYMLQVSKLAPSLRTAASPLRFAAPPRLPDNPASRAASPPWPCPSRPPRKIAPAPQLSQKGQELSLPGSRKAGGLQPANADTQVLCAHSRAR